MRRLAKNGGRDCELVQIFIKTPRSQISSHLEHETAVPSMKTRVHRRLSICSIHRTEPSNVSNCRENGSRSSLSTGLEIFSARLFVHVVSEGHNELFLVFAIACPAIRINNRKEKSVGRDQPERQGQPQCSFSPVSSSSRVSISLGLLRFRAHPFNLVSLVASEAWHKSVCYLNENP